MVLEKRIHENYISSNFNLRELWNCDWKLILCPPQNKRKDNQHSKLPFLKINFHFSTYGTAPPPLPQPPPHKQYLFHIFFSTNAKKTYTDQSILQTFLLCLKSKISKTFKSSSLKKSFPSVYTFDTNYFDEFFLFHMVTERHCVLYKL